MEEGKPRHSNLNIMHETEEGSAPSLSHHCPTAGAQHPFLGRVGVGGAGNSSPDKSEPLDWSMAPALILSIYFWRGFIIIAAYGDTRSSQRLSFYLTL